MSYKGGLDIKQKKIHDKQKHAQTLDIPKQPLVLLLFRKTSTKHYKARYTIQALYLKAQMKSGLE